MLVDNVMGALALRKINLDLNLSAAGVTIVRKRQTGLFLAILLY